MVYYYYKLCLEEEGKGKKKTFYPRICEMMGKEKKKFERRGASRGWPRVTQNSLDFNCKSSMGGTFRLTTAPGK